MRSFEGPVEGANGLLDYLNDRAEALPEDVRAKLVTASRERSPVVACFTAAELIYARAAELPAGVKDLAAGLSVMLATHGFHDFDRNGRGVRIAGALRREAGTVPDGVEAQAADKDPAPLSQFLPAEPEKDSGPGGG